MFRFISNEALKILTCLNRTSMTIQQLSEYRNSTPIWGPVEANSGSVYREVKILQHWGLIRWARQRGEIQNIYHITEAGRKFLRDCILIETSNRFDENRGFTSVVTISDIMEKNKRSQYINERRVFVRTTIGRIKKSKSLLGKREKARQLLLQYHLHRFQGELRWLDEINGSQGQQNE